MPHYLATHLLVNPGLGGEFLYYYTQGEFSNEPEALHMMCRCARIMSHVSSCSPFGVEEAPTSLSLLAAVFVRALS